MKEHIAAMLTAKDDKSACGYADKIVSESSESDAWYAHIDVFACLLSHPKSLVRNRALGILAANARWDDAHHFDALLPDLLAHITDEKSITVRQCVKTLTDIGTAQPRYIPAILSAIDDADLSRYGDSMRPLIERDIEKTRAILAAVGNRSGL